MNTIKAVVFDLYGTLYDVHSVRTLCERLYPERGEAISRMWRQKQLEYTWMRCLMGQYKDFESATVEALRHTCGSLGLALTPAGEASLCNEYLRLAPFAEVPQALQRLRSAGLKTAILSNGSRHSIRQVVENSGLTASFDHLISVDEVRQFKPHPEVYQLALDTLNLDKADILFVSCNSWDATGAKYFGYPVCWINRSGGVFDELGVSPDLVRKDVGDLAARFPVAGALENVS